MALCLCFSKLHNIHKKKKELDSNVSFQKSWLNCCEQFHVVTFLLNPPAYVIGWFAFLFNFLPCWPLTCKNHSLKTHGNSEIHKLYTVFYDKKCNIIWKCDARIRVFPLQQKYDYDSNYEATFGFLLSLFLGGKFSRIYFKCTTTYFSLFQKKLLKNWGKGS